MSLKSQIITRRELFAAAGVGATAYWLKMPLARAVEEPPPADPYLVLRVPGAVKPFSFAHLSDIHLCAADERDSDEIQEYMKMRARVAFGETPNQMAQQVFEKVNQWKPDFVAITGDFIDYPALACIELGGKLLEMLDAPCWHAVGNHDWWEMDPPGREHWFTRLNAAWGPQPLDLFLQRFAGVNLIFVDNSSAQVSPSQVTRTKRAVKTGRPCLVFMHVPLSIPSLDAASCAHVEGQTVLMPCPERDQSEPSRKEWIASTEEFGELLRESKNVHALFVGHLHVDRADEIADGRSQYVVDAAFRGHWRRVRVEPVD
ncbi:MAG: metallophosphoesterase family protein [Pirellulaceae bacterium]